MVLSGLFHLYELVQACTSLYKLKKVSCKFTDVPYYIGWETIFKVLGSVSRPALSDPTSQSDPSSPGRGRPPLLRDLQERGFSALIKISSNCMTLMCDALAALSPEHLRLCISTLGQFGRQAEKNIVSSGASRTRYRRRGQEVDHEQAYSALWMHLLSLLFEILRLCAWARFRPCLGPCSCMVPRLALTRGTSACGRSHSRCLTRSRRT
jgi:hypothetical protein